jgi:hypothetical protein
MHRRVFAAIVALIMLGIDSPQLAQHQQVAVVVHNRARVSDTIMLEARSIVQSVYAQAGVQLEWFSATPTSHMSFVGQRVHIIILTEDVAAKVRYSADAVGFTPGRTGHHGNLAYILEHRVRLIAQGYRILPGVVLGAAMAHEIGHMLLQGGHTATGLMRAEFNQADLRRIMSGQLRLSLAEAANLRSRLMTPPVNVPLSAHQLIE